MNSPVLKKIISALIAVLLLVYVGNQIYNANYAQVKTETASYADPSDTVQTTAFIIRNEQVISNTSSGVVGYTVSNGSKVANKEPIANLYNSAKDATVQQQLENLNSEIERLTKLSNPGDTYAVKPDLLDKQIDLKFTELLENYQSRDCSQLSQTREDLLYLLNERQIVTGKEQNFNKRLAALNSQKTALAAGSKSIGTIISPASGYFINKADGYETVFDYDHVDKLTVSDLKAKQSQKVAPPNNAIGKVCQAYDWYVACVLPAESAEKLKHVDNVNVTLPFALSKSIPAQVVAVNQVNKDAEGAVILKCSYMSSELAAIRNETVQIQIDDYSGIRISQKAIHFANTYTGRNGKTVTSKNAVKGVYVMHGSQIEFVQIFPIFSSGSYVICNDEPDEKDILTRSTLKLYDEVVTEGTDLYDGKVVK